MRPLLASVVFLALLLQSAEAAGWTSSSMTTTHASTGSRLALAFLQEPRVGHPVDLQLVVHPSQDLQDAWVELVAPDVLNVTPKPGLEADFTQGVARTFTWRLLASEPVAVRLVAYLSTEARSEDSVEQSVFFGLDQGIVDLYGFLRDDPGLQGNLTAHVDGGDLVVQATYATQPRGWQAVSQVELKLRERQAGETVQEPITHGAADRPASTTLRIPLQPGQRTYDIEVEYQVKVMGYAAYIPGRAFAVETVDLCNAPLTVSLDDLGAVASPCDDDPVPAAPASPAPASVVWLVGPFLLALARRKRKAHP